MKMSGRTRYPTFLITFPLPVKDRFANEEEGFEIIYCNCSPVLYKVYFEFIMNLLRAEISSVLSYK